ncbi:aromatic ring-hydroxylating oxygenase subunit alpha [Parageobacillus thermoglucosidasius]|uniref:aromatic ring-hydroxylating oxygenase subunit alpha n=1 Tax=Parageobacillus thermoglucosidasius TaxID=1426 RepID=UPI000B550833|nr:aromatic ring-hydroxylating dioxygenase subunit alpha [Parageobacillus thermoglucosidasius]OUM86328.1 MAG: p-cumate dioxygenase [Parageobacillus thermoglucosidasius]
MSLDIQKGQDLIRVDEEKCEFKVHRKAFTENEILKMEKEKIFDKCWLYLGHESEIPNPGDFKTRRVGGRNLIFNRDTDGQIRALLNTCTHRGAMVCREREGNTKVFQCFYHAWTFNSKGELVGVPGRDGYPEHFNCDGKMNLRQVPRLSSYRGFLFVNFDSNAVELEEYLAGAKEYLDIVADHSEIGMEVVGGTQEYSIRANWKLLAENSVDGYHGFPTHKTYFDYVQSRGGQLTKDDLTGIGRNLGNGHAVVEYQAPWGRPIAKWIPAWGEKGKQEIDSIVQNLVNRFGEERARRIAERNRNLLIFPNLVINDIMSVTIRTFYPVSVDYMEVNAWCLAPKEENDDFRERRLNNFLEFLGPGGFATPDDIEALELCQAGFMNNKEVEWNDISKGMNREPQTTDEIQMRSFWLKWNELMTK